MKELMVTLVLAIALLSRPATTAPICQDRSGETVRCGTPAAMPVGWTLPAAEAWQYRLRHPAMPTNQLLKAVAVIVLFFALIALMPKFDGRRDEDWE